MTKIKDQVVWLTGASSGIGEALAYELSKEGAKLILSARREQELARVKQQCVNPSNIKILPLDLSDAASLISKAEKAESLFGEIDILIHSGGISQRDRAVNTSIDVDRKIMEVNYFGSIALSKAVLPEMVKRKKGHHVIISSATGIVSSPLRSGYAASKHALHGFYDALRAEHFKDNILVSIICPGYIKTNISINALMGDGSNQNKMDDAQAKGISAEECAKRTIKAIKKEKEEVYIAKSRELMGIYIKRFFPSLFSKIIRNIKVT
ncbi:MAG: SDR family oxidoreductase [Bacteroidota bacterium]